MTREDILKILGIENSDPLTQNELLQQVSSSVSTRILNKVTEQLDDNDLDELSKLIDADDEAAVSSYIESKIPDFESFKAKIEEDTIREIGNNSKGLVEKANHIQSDTITT
jgi:hypothetical protein